MIVFGGLTQYRKADCFSLIIISHLGCRVQLALTERCCCRRSQRGKGSSHSGTSCQLKGQRCPLDKEMAQMNRPHSRNLSTYMLYCTTELFVYSAYKRAYLFCFFITWWAAVTYGLPRWWLKCARVADGWLSTTIWACVASRALTSCDRVRSHLHLCCLVYSKNNTQAYFYVREVCLTVSTARLLYLIMTSLVCEGMNEKTWKTAFLN